MRQNYKNGELIFRQGETGSCMYVIQSGKVGIYLNYGESEQTKLTELSVGQFLGEMGLLDKLPRSATAISLSDDTALEVIDEANFEQSFAENPAKMLSLLQQMSVRLRRISRDYGDACRTVSDVVEAEKAGKEKDAALRNRIAKTLAGFAVSRLDDREEGGAAI